MKWFLTITAVAALIAAMTLGYLGHDDLLVAGLIAALAFLVAANLDRLSEFKASAGGIEARTREVVNRAESAITELQVLALHSAKVSLSLAMRQGRLGGFSDDELERLKTSVLTNLSNLGIPEPKCQSVLADWNRVVEFDYAHHILGHSRTPENVSPEVLATWKALREGGIDSFPSRDEIEQFLHASQLMSPERVEYLEDYRYFKANHQHRRPEVWRERKNWSHLKKA